MYGFRFLVLLSYSIRLNSKESLPTMISKLLPKAKKYFGATLVEPCTFNSKKRSTTARLQATSGKN